MTATLTTLAEYIFARLRQLGIESIHGVPGDFSLKLLDYIEPSGLRWVGNCNELNAGYAADGYARIKGTGAVITTFGVGELSAINAIAGAYAERAAVVHIVGTPSRASQDARCLIHHTFNDGDYGRFAQMHTHITVAQANLRNLSTAPDQIDEVLRQCLMHSRPVYITIPEDMVAASVPAARLRTAIAFPETEPIARHEAALTHILQKIHTAKQPMILVDGESRALDIVDEVQRIVKATNWPTWTTIFAKGLLDETLENVHGVYRGAFDDPKVKAFVDTSDLVLCFGPHFSSTNSYAYSSIPDSSVTISFTDNQVESGDQIFRDIPTKKGLSWLIEQLDLSRLETYSTPYPDLPQDYTILPASLPRGEAITQDRLWRVLASFIRPGDIVLAETGTAGYGCREMPLPPQTRLFAPVTWLSIGYMLPAAQGAALAQREHLSSGAYGDNIEEGRTILLVGDGSFQVTAQELGTIIRHDLDVIVFLINNDGYTIERSIHGLRQAYNDIAFWRYLQAPSFFGADDQVYTATARTWGDLDQILRCQPMMRGHGLRMAEILLDREDVPPGPLLAFMNQQKGKA